MRNGIKVRFHDGKQLQALIFDVDGDTESTVAAMVARMNENGWKAVNTWDEEKHTYVLGIPMVHDPRKGWVRREFEPSLRQMLGMRPVWKVG